MNSLSSFDVTVVVGVVMMSYHVPGGSSLCMCLRCMGLSSGSSVCTVSCFSLIITTILWRTMDPNNG